MAGTDASPPPWLRWQKVVQGWTCFPSNHRHYWPLGVYIHTYIHTQTDRPGEEEHTLAQKNDFGLVLAGLRMRRNLQFESAFFFFDSGDWKACRVG